MSFWRRSITLRGAVYPPKALYSAIEWLRNDSKICLFVDGLDEFEHDHADLIAMVKDLVCRSDHVKVCVASRPWNVFQDALGQKPSLRMEDLTFDDIKSLVQSRFYADKEFEILGRRYPEFTNELLESIVKKASGVFLWVDLVVTSLLAGMRLGDRIQDFQRRLDEPPADLESLYAKILHSLDPFYISHASQYFALVEAAEDPLTIAQFSIADDETPESAIEASSDPRSTDEISLQINAMSRRLNSRCKGFLETARRLGTSPAGSVGSSSGMTVQYLHRTVRDYIKSPEAQDFLRISVNHDFDPSLQLCVAYVMQRKKTLRIVVAPRLRI